MKFIILAFHPAFVNQEDIKILVAKLEFQYSGFQVFTIAHLNNDMEPLYCVQFADTSDK